MRLLCKFQPNHCFLTDLFKCVFSLSSILNVLLSFTIRIFAGWGYTSILYIYLVNPLLAWVGEQYYPLTVDPRMTIYVLHVKTYVLQGLIWCAYLFFLPFIYWYGVHICFEGVDLIRQNWKKGPSVQEGYGSGAVFPEQGIYLAAFVYRPVLQVWNSSCLYTFCCGFYNCVVLQLFPAVHR